MGVIRIGRFDGWGGEDTLLIEGDRVGFKSLIAAIERLQGARPLVVLHEWPEVVVHGGVKCTLELVSEDRGLVVRDNAAFAWRRSAAGWLDIVEKLRVLQESSHPGHHYLDGPNDDLQVIATVGEYGEAWWRTHAG